MTRTTSQLSLPGDRIRNHIILTGVLQGIGCRPTVYRLATRLGLAGWVINSTSGVHIEIEGTAEQCRSFLEELPHEIPAPGRIDTTRLGNVSPLGETGFRIEASLEDQRSITPIPPDVATCDACVEELFQPSNPRYLYPFITCTLCGPRFTVVRGFPYDRERTSMADFIMCPRCLDEYHNPADRRFHSQTNSCPECGPKLVLVDLDGAGVPGDPVVQTLRFLEQGKVIAIKGIGGFHLACDALNEDAVARLRERKGRLEKPFAVMMPDVPTIRRYCEVNSREEQLLTSAVAPIVLLRTGVQRLAPNVAPLVGTVGVMLPYAPLHHLLFKHPEGAAEGRRLQALVMTSGNRSEEPIARDNEEAVTRLRDLADAFLCHDREIVLRADDSIFRVIADRSTVFRRSRGLVPGGFSLSSGAAPDACNPHECADPGTESATYPVVLATGGDLKSCLAVAKGEQIVPGPHVGDLGSPVAQAYFQQSVEVLTGYLEAVPEIVALDPHPEYFSNSLGREIGLPVTEVFHHHAHAVSLLVQEGIKGPALFAVFDGTGYGTDASIWGGEFLMADRESFQRMGHLTPFPLPGGEAAIREPARILAALLASHGSFPEEFMQLMGHYRENVPRWLEAVNRRLNSPLTSSAGRLFDAAASATGFLRQVTFEGQAAMWLEGIADPAEVEEYPVRFSREHPFVPDVRALILELCRDMLSGSSAERVSARFHNSMARLVADMLGKLSQTTGTTTVGLTGGCFQNRLFTERTVDRLRERGLEVLLHESIPPNDGGIAVGQAVSARARYHGT